MRTRFSRRNKLIYYYHALQELEENKNFDEFQEDLNPERSDNSSEESGSLKFDFDDNKQFCDMMLPNKRGESLDGRSGLDILERCWERLQKAAVRGNVLRRLLRKVSSPEDVKRLQGWRKKMKTETPSASKEIGGNGNEGTISEKVVDRQWAWDILDTVDATVEALKHCRSMMHQTFKEVFK